MTVNFAHCFFEQPGVFRDEFNKLGIPAKDYDIDNQFGKTDIVVDLFSHIENAYSGKVSLFDDIQQDNIIMAFFPCTYFSGQNEMFFCGTYYNFRMLSKPD